MNVKNLTKLYVVGISVLALCILVLPVVVNAKAQVERPFKVKAEGDLHYISVISAWAVDVGQCSHGGLFTNEWSIVGEVTTGVATFKNGDKRFWKAEGNKIIFTGGTGKYEGCSGWFEYTMIYGVPSEDGSIPISYTGEGKLTY